MRSWLIALALAITSPATANPAVANEPALSQLRALQDFDGSVLIARGDKVKFQKGDTEREIWRWASVTKQIIAVLVMQEVAAGRLDLDTPLGRYLPGFTGPGAASITVRRLLQHQSGLPNPDDTAVTASAVPAFYEPGFRGDRNPLTGFCAGASATPAPTGWAYNNCDYIVLGAVLEAVTGQSWQKLVRERLIEPLRLRSVGAFPTRRAHVSGFENGRAEPRYDFAAFGASAGLFGTLEDLRKVDRALMGGSLLPPAQREILWTGNPQLGFMALGQWVFSSKLASCSRPVRIVERRGQIGGVQVRNLMIPEQDLVVIMFARNSETDFGEIWQGKGLAHDVLNTALCPEENKQ